MEQICGQLLCFYGADLWSRSAPYQQKLYVRMFSPPAEGLLACLNEDYQFMIVNPSTGQFLQLPKVDSIPFSEPRRAFFFGYDSQERKHKLLTMARRHFGVMEDFRVVTLGGGPGNGWRMIQCPFQHVVCPYTKGVQKGGIVYYQATMDKIGVLMFFHVSNESFTYVKLPGDGRPLYLSTYGDTVALWPTLLTGGRLFEIWVLDNPTNKGKWSYVSFEIPDTKWSAYFANQSIEFYLKGKIATSELVFQHSPQISPFRLLKYDLVKAELQVITIEDAAGEVFLDHVESPLIPMLCFEDERIPESYIKTYISWYEKYKDEMKEALKETDEHKKKHLTNEVIQRYRQDFYGGAEFKDSNKSLGELNLQALALYHIVYNYAMQAGVTKCGFVWKVAGPVLCRFYLEKTQEKSIICSTSVLKMLFG